MADVRMRASLARIHFRNAELFRDNANEIESVFGDNTSSNIPQRKREDHTAYCFNAILSAISFVDATANEFVDDLVEDSIRVDQGNQPHFYPDIDQQFRADIVAAPNRDNRLRNASPPIKFNVLLDMMGLNEFDRDSSPLEPVRVLNRLRSELAHYSPEWVEGGPKHYTANEFGFEEDLQGRFDQNPLTASGNAFFPDQCMSYGCTAWAVRQSQALVSHFGRKVGVDMRPLQ